MTTRQEVNTPLICTVGVVSGLLLLVAVFGIQAWFYSAEREEISRKMDLSGNPWLESLRRDQAHNLTTGKWVDVEKQIVTIPIDRAKAYVVAHEGRLPQSPSPGPATATSQVVTSTSPTAIAPIARTPLRGLAGASPAVKRGKGVYVTNLCATCHSANGTRLIGPTHLNLLGREETMMDGSKVVVDEAYIRESILEPQKRVVKDFPPIMPPMKDKLTPAQLDDLVAYLRFLSPNAPPAGAKP